MTSHRPRLLIPILLAWCTLLSSVLAKDQFEAFLVSRQYTDAQPIRKLSLGSQVSIDEPAQFVFCQTAELDGQSVVVDGIRITDGVSLAFIIDKNAYSDDLLSDDEEVFAESWMKLRISLHDEKVGGKVEEIRRNADLPYQLQQRREALDATKLPSGF